MSLDLSNFVNCYCQYRDVTSLPDARRVLLIGVGKGLEPAVLRFAGYDVVTADLDAELRPDHVLSVDDLGAFADRSFDVAIASHVLEHLPWSRFERCLAELARVARHCLIYLPLAGGAWGIRWFSSAPAMDVSWALNLANPLRSIDGESAVLMDGQHYWEIGRPGFPLARVREAIARHFDIHKAYRNEQWPLSYNFVCVSKHAARTGSS